MVHMPDCIFYSGHKISQPSAPAMFTGMSLFYEDSQNTPFKIVTYKHPPSPPFLSPLIYTCFPKALYHLTSIYMILYFIVYGLSQDTPLSPAWI